MIKLYLILNTPNIYILTDSSEKKKEQNKMCVRCLRRLSKFCDYRNGANIIDVKTIHNQKLCAF